LDAINKIYQFENVVENFKDIHTFIENENLYPPVKDFAEIFGYAFILDIRSNYPRLFLLVTVKNNSKIKK